MSKPKKQVIQNSSTGKIMLRRQKLKDKYNPKPLDNKTNIR